MSMLFDTPEEGRNQILLAINPARKRGGPIIRLLIFSAVYVIRLLPCTTSKSRLGGDLPKLRELFS